MIQFHDNVINSSSQVKLSCLPPAQLPDQDIMWNKSSEQHEQEIEARKLGLLVVFVSLMCAQKTEFMTLFSKLPQESQYCLAFKLKPVCYREKKKKLLGYSIEFLLTFSSF